MTTVHDAQGHQTWPKPPVGEDHGITWHLHTACDADQRTRHPEITELAGGFEIKEVAR